MFKRILLATDGSAASYHAAGLAVSLARQHGASLTVLYVVDPYPFLGVGEVNPLGFDAYMAAAREQAARAQAQVTERVAQSGGGVQVNARLVEDVAVLDGILKTVQQEACDLVVIGSHGRTGLSRIMLGSVAAKVVAQSPVPVLVAR